MTFSQKEGLPTPSGWEPHPFAVNHSSALVNRQEERSQKESGSNKFQGKPQKVQM